MKIKEILVLMDFSESSKNALQAAIHLAKKSDAKIILLNAVHVHTPLPHLRGGSLIEAVVADYEWQVKEAFDELESEMVELKDVPHENDKYLAYLMDAVYTESQNRDIDLIVMGTRSEHSMGERLIGTNATDIIRTSDIPVLIIPEKYHGFEPKVIGFASDFLRVPDYGPLHILKTLAALYQSEVMVFHVANEINENQQGEINKIKEALDSLDKVSIRIVSADSVVGGIQEFIKTHKLDLLTLMPREHNLFERLFVPSVSKAITIDIDIPLLTFHE